MIVGAPDLPATAAVIAALRARFRPRGIMAVRADAGGASPGQRPEHPLDALFLERPGAAGVATLYACSADRCLPPVTGDDALALAAKPLTEEPLRPR